MRYSFIITITSIFFLCIEASATSPPFTTVTIHGKADTKFNKVSLFKDGHSNEPLKSEKVSYYNGEYSITVDIPADMRKKKNYYFADMRFWNDSNDNGFKEKGESLSECHFVIWVPAAKKIYLQVYKGSKYLIDSPYFKYYYQ